MRTTSQTAELETEIRALELRLLNRRVRTSPEAVKMLLAGDFIEFGSSGRIFDRAQVCVALGKEPETRISIRQFRLRRLGPAAVLVTYRAAARVGSEKAPRRSLRSSVWIRRQGQWRLAFHQGTRAMKLRARGTPRGRR